MEYLPAEQSKQGPEPFTDLYLPGPHAIHAGPPSGPVYPRSHLQSPTAELDSAEMAFVGHAMHMLLLAAE